MPGYSRRVCNRWKMTKIRSANRDSMPMPLSVTENSQSSASLPGVDVDARSGLAAELDRVADQVLEQLTQLRCDRPAAWEARRG